jgi:MMP 1-O-methyltransferase
MPSEGRFVGTGSVHVALTIGSRALGASEPRQVRKEAALRTPSQVPRLRPVRAGDTDTSGDTDLDDGARGRAQYSAMIAPSQVTDQSLLPEDVDRLLADVDGWFGGKEGRLLYRLASEADPAGVIVEIGSWHGRSTIWLAAGAAAGRGASVVAIDPHQGTHLRPDGHTTEAALRANLERAGLAARVRVVVSTSTDAAATWSKPVSLLWIDGDHAYESASRDFDLWEPFLLADAVVALHDTFVWSGPERVVRDRLIRTRRFTSFEYAETTTTARRCGRLGPRASLARRVMLARRSLYGIRLRAYDTNRFGYATLRDMFGGC